MINLAAEEVLHIKVRCGEVMPVGAGPEGRLNVIPLIGGEVDGIFKGTVVSGGADWSITNNCGNHVFAKYLLKTDSGEYIAIENEGILTDEKRRISTVPKFYLDRNSKYNELNSGVYVASLEVGGPEFIVDIHIYKMK